MTNRETKSRELCGWSKQKDALWDQSDWGTARQEVPVSHCFVSQSTSKNTVELLRKPSQEWKSNGVTHLLTSLTHVSPRHALKRDIYIYTHTHIMTFTRHTPRENLQRPCCKTLQHPTTSDWESQRRIYVLTACSMWRITSYPPALCHGEMEEASLPCGVWRRFHMALAALLPNAVCQLIPNRRHHLDELYRPVIQVKRADPREVCAKVSVYTWAFDAYKCSQIQAGPVRVCGKKKHKQLDNKTPNKA